VRDPHVKSLTYELVLSERTSFVDSPEPIDDGTDAFSMRLDDGMVTFEMHEHHASEASARHAVEPYLRAWEIDHALWAGSPEISFEFERAQVIDRDPPPPPKPGEPETVTVEGTATVSMKASISATGTVTRGSYPKPPKNFALDPDVETLWQRWEGYLAGREPLASMGYFCKTVVDIMGGGGQLGISRPVLRKLGQLTSTAGGRKASGARPLTGAERAWVEATVKALIRRAGEAAAGASPSLLTMADLPSL
jgi:hypothetical protein